MMEIDNKIIDFQVQTGKRPTNIYLGKQQWDVLMKWAYINCGYFHDAEGRDVPEYQDCRVYKVNVENHVMCSGRVTEMKEGEIDEWHALNIKLQMEMLITEREGMIAENLQRVHRGESMAYVEDSFQMLNARFTHLWEVLKVYG